MFPRELPTHPLPSSLDRGPQMSVFHKGPGEVQRSLKPKAEVGMRHGSISREYRSVSSRPQKPILTPKHPALLSWLLTSISYPLKNTISFGLMKGLGEN